MSISYIPNLICDVVIESISKYLGGGEIIMGFVAGDEKTIVKLYRASRMMGIHLSPTDCSKAMQSLKTLELRMKQCLTISSAVLEYLKNKEHINELFHSSSYGVNSAIITFTTKIPKNILFENMNKFQWIKIATSYGKGETLIDPYLLKSKQIVIRLAIGYDPYISSFENIKSDLDKIFS